MYSLFGGGIFGAQQAKILSDKQVGAVLGDSGTTLSGPGPNDVPAEHQSRDARHRNRPCHLEHGDRRRARIAHTIALENRTSKRKRGGRIIPLHPDLKSALIALLRERGEEARQSAGSL